MKRSISSFILVLCFLGIPILIAAQRPSHDLQFTTLATEWDEGIPLGNGMLGALVWEKAGRLHMSLDRADLWDLRPMKGVDRPEFNYRWVYDHVLNGQYALVQKYFDAPYEEEAAPSKIPGGALEFNSEGWGKVISVRLSIIDALCEVQWENGARLTTFVDATGPVGWFRIEHLHEAFFPELITPPYTHHASQSPGGSVAGDDLVRLGYPPGKVVKRKHAILYDQKGWDGFHYQMATDWKRVDSTTIEGVWSISSSFSGANASAAILVHRALRGSYDQSYRQHAAWWRQYWQQSSIQVPDSTIEKQWYLEQYKFGSVARKGSPVITLQAIWTADNGRIPPWKGDVHNDLNTQLSYWPAYSGNHLKQAESFTDWLWKTKAQSEKYTQRFFGVSGLNVPGVQTLLGAPMGGWTQYSCSPTIAAWLSQHFYWQWKYSLDSSFLRNRAYPWIKAAAGFLENITTKDSTGYRKLPISSSPEINNNDITAWFFQNTNYDLSLMKFCFGAAAELANALGLNKEAAHWENLLSQLGPYALSGNDELMFAPTLPYQQSHRHFSHMMAIYPLGLIRWENGQKDQEIIRRSIHRLDSIGPGEWCGYSYAWLASLKARAKDGVGAAQALKIFAKAFCLKNSFHVNGDQTKSGYSGFTYKPFTLEGNFAFASGLQEMLLQSYAGFIEVFPAIPPAWDKVSFDQLRAQGAFLVSARKMGSKVATVKIWSEKGGTAKLKLPFSHWSTSLKKGVMGMHTVDGLVEVTFEKGGVIELKNTDEIQASSY